MPFSTSCLDPSIDKRNIGLYQIFSNYWNLMSVKKYWSISNIFKSLKCNVCHLLITWYHDRWRKLSHLGFWVGSLELIVLFVWTLHFSPEFCVFKEAPLQKASCFQPRTALCALFSPQSILARVWPWKSTPHPSLLNKQLTPFCRIQVWSLPCPVRPSVTHWPCCIVKVVVNMDLPKFIFGFL